MPPKKGKKTFTVKWINSIKPAKKEIIWTESQGFTIRVLPSGVKTWWYYYTHNGKRNKMNLGNYPSVSLEDARRFHREALALVDHGIDPKQPPPPLLPEPEIITVRNLAKKWHEEWSSRHHSPKWANTLKLAIEKDILPEYGDVPVNDIRKKTAIEILEKKAQTAPGQAVNLHKALRGMWEYALDREIVEFNPFAAIKPSKTIPAMKQKSRDRVLNDQEIKFLWTAIEQGGGSDSTQRALKMMLITGQRNGEVCGMHYDEIQIGIGKSRCLECKCCGWWTIPEKRREGNKGGEHRVFLSRQAMQLIGDRTGYIFPNDDSPISANSVNQHVRRTVPSTGKLPYYKLPRWTPHDLRRTCGTGIRRCGGSRDNMDLILGHVTKGVTGVYDLYAGDLEKEIWLTIWGEYIELLLTSDS